MIDGSTDRKCLPVFKGAWHGAARRKVQGGRASGGHRLALPCSKRCWLLGNAGKGLLACFIKAAEERNGGAAWACRLRAQSSSTAAPPTMQPHAKHRTQNRTGMDAADGCFAAGRPLRGQTQATAQQHERVWLHALSRAGGGSLVHRPERCGHARIQALVARGARLSCASGRGILG